MKTARAAGRIACLCLAVFCWTLLSPAPAKSASPEDLVPRGAALYDAVALLSAHHLLADGAPDTTDLQGITGRLYTRREFAALIRPITDSPADPRVAAALAFCRNLLAPELGNSEEFVPFPQTSAPALLGFGEAEWGGRSDGGNLRRHGELLGRARFLGTLGRDGAYTISLTNISRQTRDHAAVSFRDDGRSGGDNPDVQAGIDEAYVTASGAHGLRVTLGKLRRRWGSGYAGDLLVSDTAPARPTLEVELPFSLGHALGEYRFTQSASVYHNGGQTIYQGERRLETPPR